jgi:hypothetical protein
MFVYLGGKNQFHVREDKAKRRITLTFSVAPVNGDYLLPRFCSLQIIDAVSALRTPFMVQLLKQVILVCLYRTMLD